MKRVIVTGGNRGIGKAIVRAFALAGDEVVFSYASSRETAEQTACEMEEATGRPCRYFAADFTDIYAAAPFIRKAEEALGGLDVLVNNAAITKTHSELFDLTEEFTDRLISANFTSQVMCMKEAALYMARNRVRGSIINISSVRGLDHVAFPHDAIYGAAKAGLDRAIQSFALSLAPYGIRVNNIAPGAVANRTRRELLATGTSVEDADYADAFARDKIPMGRAGRPEDIADAVMFLASESASYITGITIPVDGGLTLAGMPERRRMPDEMDKGWGYVRMRDRF